MPRAGPPCSCMIDQCSRCQRFQTACSTSTTCSLGSSTALRLTAPHGMLNAGMRDLGFRIDPFGKRAGLSSTMSHTDSADHDGPGGLRRRAAAKAAGIPKRKKRPVSRLRCARAGAADERSSAGRARRMFGGGAARAATGVAFPRVYRHLGGSHPASASGSHGVRVPDPPACHRALSAIFKSESVTCLLKIAATRR